MYASNEKYKCNFDAIFGLTHSHYNSSSSFSSSSFSFSSCNFDVHEGDRETKSERVVSCDLFDADIFYIIINKYIYDSCILCTHTHFHKSRLNGLYKFYVKIYVDFILYIYIYVLHAGSVPSFNFFFILMMNWNGKRKNKHVFHFNIQNIDSFKQKIELQFQKHDSNPIACMYVYVCTFDMQF